MLLPPEVPAQVRTAVAAEDLGSAIPAPVLALGHCFYVPMLGRVSSVMHFPAHISSVATLTPQALTLHFQSLSDELCFELDRAQLTSLSSWVATYPVRSTGQPLAPVGVWYHYTRQDARGLRISTLQFSSASCQLRGYVAITAYDAQRQLLSGHYEVRANNQRDPSDAPAASNAACTIMLAGDFEYIRLRLF